MNAPCIDILHIQHGAGNPEFQKWLVCVHIEIAWVLQRTSQIFRDTSSRMIHVSQDDHVATS